MRNRARMSNALGTAASGRFYAHPRPKLQQLLFSPAHSDRARNQLEIGFRRGQRQLAMSSDSTKLVVRPGNAQLVARLIFMFGRGRGPGRSGRDWPDEFGASQEPVIGCRFPEISALQNCGVRWHGFVTGVGITPAGRDDVNPQRSMGFAAQTRRPRLRSWY
jgi:hypothetical protein